MAVHLTMEDAVEQAREEIWLYHTMHGFPAMLTHHSSREAPRQLSHEGDYDDRGNLTGSILTYALMFTCEDEDSILTIFDKTNERADVYAYWGAEGQKSGRGSDNDRTNLLEAILGQMGSDGKSTQRAWDLFDRYSLRYPTLTRQELLQQALEDTCPDIYTHDIALANAIMQELDQSWNTGKCVQFQLLFPYLREHSEVPLYREMCRLTGTRNRSTYFHVF